MLHSSLIEWSLDLLPFHKDHGDKCTVKHVTDSGRVSYTYTDGFITYNGKASVIQRNGKYIVRKRLADGKYQQRTVQQ